MLQYVTVWNISFDNISSAVNTGEINTTDLFWPLFFFPDITDELTGILKKLSLEKYQPIFEEQEVNLF